MQHVSLEELTPQRILFGFFPTYRVSPLAPAFDRVLQIGDASGIQSPLSFGGFGAMTRHLARLTEGLTEALQVRMAWISPATADSASSVKFHERNCAMCQHAPPS